LCHDDVIDEADTRRGVDSVNARWGNLKAILAGDFLLAKASEIAASLGTEVAGLLAATIGRLCEGEVHELRMAYNADRTEESYTAAIAGKTAALFATACRVGGIVGDLPRADIDRLTEFGQRYGMAFQVVDDILDVIATEEELGKPAGHDIAEGIYNLPVRRALQGPHGEELRALLGRPIEARSWSGPASWSEPTTAWRSPRRWPAATWPRRSPAWSPSGTPWPWRRCGARPSTWSPRSDLARRAPGAASPVGRAGEQGREAPGGEVAEQRHRDRDREGRGERGAQRPAARFAERHERAAGTGAERGAEQVGQLQRGRRRALPARLGQLEHGDRQRRGGQPGPEAGHAPDGDRRPDRQGAEGPEHAEDPDPDDEEPEADEAAGPDPVDPPLLHPRPAGPGDGGRREGGAGHPGGLVAHVLVRERHVGVGPEEREGEHPPHEHGGGHPGLQAQGAGRHEPGVGHDAGGHAHPDEHDGEH